MPKAMLHPLLSVFCYVLAALSVVQWCLVLPLVIQLDLMTSLDCWIGDRVGGAVECGAYTRVLFDDSSLTRVVPFQRDFFFIEWNILPILLGVAHHMITTYYRNHVDQLRIRFGEQDGAPLPITQARLRDSVVMLLLMLGSVSAISVFAQLDKQALFTANREFFYWWSLEISPTLYYIRLFFVVTNIILVALVLWESYWGLVTLFRLARRRTPNPIFLDPDRRFGMQSFGVLLMLLLTPWFLGLATAILGWLDHHGRQGAANAFGTLFMGVIGVAGLYLISEPLVRIRMALDRSKATLLGVLSQEIAGLESALSSIARGENDGGDVGRRATPAYLVFSHVSNSSAWPLPRWIGIPTLISLISPFLGAFGISLSTAIELLIEYMRSVT